MTNPRELVERLLELAGDDHERLSCNARYAECSCGYTARMEAAVLEAASEITRLCDFITALEDGNMTFLCDQLDRAKEENARLRGLLEEAKGVLGPVALAGRTLSTRWEDHEIHWHSALSQPLQVSTLRAASSLLKRLEGE